MFQRNKGKSIIALVLMLLFVFPFQVFADHDHDTSNNLLEEVYTVYELTDAKKYNAASTKLEQIRVAISNGHLDLPDEKLNFVNETILNIVQELNSEALSHESKMTELYRFMVMMETANNHKNEIYVSMKSQLRDQILDALESDAIDFEQSYQRTVDLYRQALYALKMEQSPDMWKKMDQQITAMVDLENNFEQMEANLNVLLSMFNFEDQVEKVSEEVQEDDDASLGWVLFSVGGVIIFTLFYVGWRKYKGEQKVKKYKKVDGS
jgi:sporulation protein YpjB